MKKLMHNKKGFTLIELLVVIAIIGLLSTLAVVALNSARLKSRDAKRVSDIKQIQTSLELYFNDQNAYPTATATVGSGAYACLGTGGFGSSACAGAYMGQVPAAPTPPTGNVYVYTSAGTTYTIAFTLEGTTGGLSSGARTATPSGIQ